MRAANWVAVMAAVTVMPCGTVLAGPFSDATGRQLYERFCASCHGDGAFGDGPVAPSLRIVVPDLTRLYQRSGGTFPAERVRRIIDGREIYPVHGTRYMPVWGVELRAAEGAEAAADAEVTRMVDKMVEYLRSIQQWPVREDQP